MAATVGNKALADVLAVLGYHYHGMYIRSLYVTWEWEVRSYIEQAVKVRIRLGILIVVN